MIKETNYSDDCLFWKFRAIFDKNGLDYVHDRGGFIKRVMTD